MIRIEKTTPSSYRVYFNDIIYLGDAEMEVDGFYNFWFSKDMSGYWTSHSLRLIAEMLDDLNKEWNDKILSDLGR
jgi:hypothetical protein